jgi:hypothetical protein
MNDVLSVAAMALYGIVGFISLIMAIKNLSAKNFLPFHEQAAGTQLGDLDPRLQKVILALMKVAGLGFLVAALLMLTFPVYNYVAPSPFLTYTVPLIALIYCAGLAGINYSLYKKTGAETPWKKSLMAILLLVVGLVLSMIIQLFQF